MVDPVDETTNLVRRVARGERHAESDLYARIEAELRARAGRLMAGQRAGHTLQPTALVHEAWVKMLGGPRGALEDRKHFVAVAARAMRQILVDHARARAMDKRGGGRWPDPLDAVEPVQGTPGWRILAVDEALERLAKQDPRAHRVSELKLFGGLEHAEIAALLSLSTRTVERAWRGAREVLREACS